MLGMIGQELIGQQRLKIEHIRVTLSRGVSGAVVGFGIWPADT